MERVVISGASGLVGTPLVKELDKKYALVILRRKLPPDITADTGRELIWNPPYPGDWAKRVDGAYAVVNLSGEPIAARRWSAVQKKKLRASRLDTVKALVDAIAQAKVRPKVFVSASAVGYYGPRDDARLDEVSPQGSGFLASLCAEWERAALAAETLGVRVVLLRTGIVLARQGGALAKMIPPFQFFLGGRLGSGRQYFSWIHLEDEVAAILKCVEDPSLRGPVNLTAPSAVTNAEFAKKLGLFLRKPASMPAPGFALKMLLGEMSQMLLTGQNVYPKKLLEAGFDFKYGSLEPALETLLK